MHIIMCLNIGTHEHHHHSLSIGDKWMINVFFKCLSTSARALDKREYLVIIRDIFC